METENEKGKQVSTNSCAQTTTNGGHNSRSDKQKSPPRPRKKRREVFHPKGVSKKKKKKGSVGYSKNSWRARRKSKIRGRINQVGTGGATTVEATAGGRGAGEKESQEAWQGESWVGVAIEPGGKTT